jgi:type I restriction enzyme S subunit
MKKYSSYKNSDVFWYKEIPTEWSISKNKFVLYEQKNIVDEFWKDYKLLSLTKNGVIERDMESGKGKFPEFFNTYKIIKNKDLIFCLYDIQETPRTIGISKNDGMITGSYNVFQTNQNSKFIYYWYLNIDDVKGLKPFYTGMRNVVRSETFMSLKIFIPSLQEQEQIVNYLDEKTTIIDKLISTKQRKLELLKEQRTTIINQVITKGLYPNVKMKDSGAEWIGDIPESWSFVRLGVLGNFSKGKGITKDKIKENGFPCVRNGEIYTTYNLRFSEPKSFIDEITITESIKVKKGTLFFTGDGETLEEIGKCVVYLGEEEIYVGGGINVFTPKTEKVSPIYLSYVMGSTSCVYQKSLGGKGEIVVHIYSKQLKDIQFGLPKLEEQKEIVEYLDKHTKEIDDLVSMEQNKIELLKEYRQSLISEVITGKIKVV